MLRLVVGFVAISLSVTTVCGADWPRFRGPNGTGIAMDKDVPIQFSSSQSLKWKVAVPGTGYSSPVVAHDRVIIQSSSLDGKSRSVLCYGTDGKLIWERKYPASTTHAHKKNSLASSTVAVDGTTIYALIWDGKTVTMRAIDLDGKDLWDHVLGGYVSQHGFGASPVVHEGIVFVNFDQDGEAAIIAVDAKTGKRRWAVPREAHRACYSTPMIRERGKQSELIVTSTTSIAAYEPQTGKEIWKWSWSPRGLRTTASSIMNDGLIFAAGGDGSGERHFVAVKLPDASSPAPGLAWELKKGTPYVPCPLYHDGHLYWVNDRGFAGCVEAATGKEVWNERLADTFHASPVLIDGRVYAPNEKGVVYVFEAKPKYKLLAKNDLKEVIAASPAVADGRIYIRGEKHLFCFASK